jgi:starch phosphorylase
MSTPPDFILKEPYLRRSSQDGKLARELEAWLAKIEDQWQSLRFGRVNVHQVDDQWQFEVHVLLGGLCPDCVQVQLYADATADCPATCVAMRREERLTGVVNGHIYRAAVPAKRPAGHYTPRIVPYHPEAFVPMETTRTVWQG